MTSCSSILESIMFICCFVSEFCVFSAAEKQFSKKKTHRGCFQVLSSMDSAKASGCVCNGSVTIYENVGLPGKAMGYLKRCN